MRYLIRVSIALALLFWAMTLHAQSQGQLTLEAVVGFVSRSRTAALTKVAAPSRAVVAQPRRAFDVTANDRRFLRSLRIAADETTEPVE